MASPVAFITSEGELVVEHTDFMNETPTTHGISTFLGNGVS